jgi:hypothetical protein
VRVLGVPPAVDDPAPHVLQVLAPVSLYLVSAPHGASVLLPLHEW